MNAKEILNNVKANKYKIVNQKNAKSKLWDIFGRIEKDDGAIIESFVYCRKCCKLFKTPHNNHSNLHRHKCYAAIKKGPQQAVLINEVVKAISTSKITTLESFCRTCMREHKPEVLTSTMTENGIKLISLYKEYKKKDSSIIKLMDILLESCPQLTIAIDDNLPKQICNSCLDQLLNLYKFQTKTLRIEQEFCALIGAYSYPLQDMDEVDLLSNNSILEDEGADVSMEPRINAYNPRKAFFTLVEKNGQIFELYNAEEQCDQAAIGSNEISIKTEDDNINTATCNDMDKLFVLPASKESDGTDSNDSNLDMENKFQLSSHLSEGVKCDTMEQECVVEENYTCDKCGKVLKTRKGIKMHLQKHLNRKTRNEPESGYICSVCGIRLKTRVTFRKHFRLHEKDETKIKNKCKFCNKVFSNATSLQDHMRTHTGERPYLCSICGKSFAISSGLKQHYIRHGTEFNYQCSLCPKKFQSASGMLTHKALVHTTVRPHACDVCGASFKRNDALTRHKIIHAEKKNKCNYCGMKFSQADQCRRHMRTHTGEKPYKCRYCERAFAQSNDMIKHLRCHVGENVYRCELCPKAFRLLRELRQHFSSHKDDDEQTKLKNMKALKDEEERIQIKIESEKSNVKSS